MVPTYRQIDQMLTAPGQPFELAEFERDGVKLRTWKNAPSSVAAALRAGLQFGERVCIAYEGEHLTYAEHHRRVASLARRLTTDFGVGKGDRVAVAMRNYPEWSIAFCAIVASGAIAVPLNAWWTGEELEYGLVDSGAKVLITDQARLDRLKSALDRLSGVQVILVRADISVSIKSFEALIDDTNVEFPDPDLAPDDVATILYTSGTTGKPKGAVLTHRNICSQLVGAQYVGVRALLRAGGQLEDLAKLAAIQQCVLASVPLFHVTGCIGALLNMLCSGGKTVMMYKWDPAKALDLVARERVTMLGGVPTMAWHLVEVADAGQRDLTSLMGIGFGGAPAAPELLRRLCHSFPKANFSNGYGLTETAATVSYNSGADYIAKPESAGVPVAVCDVIAVNAQGLPVATGELGELWVRGPNVVAGYWQRPDATAQAFTDGWFHTGDIGRIDDEGYLYIIDRVKDMIIRGGENIYCSEVEHVLVEHPKVKTVAVIGIPHEVLGEEVGAVVEIDSANPPSADELRAFAAEKLAAFKIPNHFWMRSEPLPMSAVGKVLKRELREQVLGQSSAAT